MFKKKFQKFIFAFASSSLILTTSFVCAAPPSMVSNGNSIHSSASYVGATEISSSFSSTNNTYSSTTGGENSLLVSNGTSTLSNIRVTKSGNESDESSDFYGTNAAILVYNGATLNISNSNISTSSSHANGIFAYGTGSVNASDINVTTSSNNSGGIMVTGGGTLTANNLTVNTDGNSSAAIRSDRGGGTMVVNGGTYTTNGTGSPAIYSTANITVNNATLNSTKSEGIVIEGKNNVTLNGATLEDTNTTLNGNSETYKNIFIYQSQSGDASEGTGYFTAKDSQITTNKGDTFYVTNTTAVINLENNVIVNNDGDFLRAEAAKWGSSGSNGSKVTITATNQKINGNIILDDISTLSMSLNSGSSYTGAINSQNSAESVSITLDNRSTLTLTGNSYITSLNNSIADNSNIDLNGYTLFIDGVAISSTNYIKNVSNTNITASADNALSNLANVDAPQETSFSNVGSAYVILVVACVSIICLIVLYLILKKGKKIQN